MDNVFAEGAAYHAEENVLSPATYQEFSTEVRSRWSRGAYASGLALWASVIEIQRNPPNMCREPDLPGIVPPIRVAPCTQIPCPRCEQLRGGFRFPYIGHFTSASAVVPEGYNVAAAWRHVPTEARPWLRRRGLFCGDLTTSCRSDHSGDQPPEPRSGRHPKHLWRVWRQWHAGSLAWIAPGRPVASQAETRMERRAQAGRTLWLWLVAVEAGEATLFPPQPITVYWVLVVLVPVIPAGMLKLPGHVEAARVMARSEDKRKRLHPCHCRIRSEIGWLKTAPAGSEPPAFCKMTKILQRRAPLGMRRWQRVEPLWPTLGWRPSQTLTTPSSYGQSPQLEQLRYLRPSKLFYMARPDAGQRDLAKSWQRRLSWRPRSNWGAQQSSSCVNGKVLFGSSLFGRPPRRRGPQCATWFVVVPRA